RPRDQCRLAAQRLTHAYPTVQYATDVPRVAARPVLSIRTMIPIRYNNSTVGPREPCQNTTVPPTITSLTAMRCAGCSASSTINTLRTGHTGISNTQTRQLFARHRVVAIPVCDLIPPGF